MWPLRDDLMVLRRRGARMGRVVNHGPQVKLRWKLLLLRGCLLLLLLSLMLLHATLEHLRDEVRFLKVELW